MPSPTRTALARFDATSLALQLALAARACAEVRAGRSLREALVAVRAARPDARHGGVQDLAYRTMRRRATGDALLARLADRAPAAALRELLVIALALASEADPPYAPHTLVDQAVAAVDALHADARAKAFVNAVLRRFLRERDDHLDAIAHDPVARWNHPAWWIDAVRAEHPQQWASILTAAQSAPPLTLRVNARRTSADAMAAQLASAGIGARRVTALPHALILDAARPVEQLPGFSEGLISVQDAGAQHAAPLLQVDDGMRVLDACAAPGGKTAHVLECASCEMLALDSDAARLARVSENLARLGLQAQVRAADAADLHAWWDGRPFDRILADVPCTASGIVRRHPDIRWLRRPHDRDQLATAARRILDALWRALAPGGTIVFVTCSIFEQEGERQLRRFLDRHADAVRLPAPGQMLPFAAIAAPSSLDHDDYDHDGFYYACIAKRR